MITACKNAGSGHWLKSLITGIFLLLVSQTFVSAQDFREIRFNQLDSLLAEEPEILHVVNFWATWCKPCVEELPYFREVAAERNENTVHFIFVSLDFANQIENTFKPFLSANPLPGEVWWLNEKKLHTLIPKIDPTWTGAIPATLFFKGSTYRQFWEGEIKRNQLAEIIDKNIH